MRLHGLAFLVLTLMPSATLSRTIVLTNDDGLTSNVKALYEALKADGHDVIVSVPCSGQSGMGAAIKFLRPLGPLAADCLNGAARAGDPGAGGMTRAGLTSDYHYVDGTPVMALLYALDVLAPKRWGRAPDLVLSGPNEGQNVGPIIISSGTVSNAQYAAHRDIPAVALSAGVDTTDNAQLANPKSADVARLSVQLVRELDKRAKAKRMLPAGLALNVNFPDKLEGARWRQARIGTHEAYVMRFTTNLSENAVARSLGLGEVALPGIAITDINAEPARGHEQDEAVIYRTDIAVSVMQVGYEPVRAVRKRGLGVLRGFLDR